MKQVMMAATLIGLAGMLVGCGRKSYGAGCESETALAAPWATLALPIDAKATRVCAATATELKLRSYDWTTDAEAQQAVGGALAAAGYVKDKCLAAACYYDKDGYTISVQAMDFSIGKKPLQTVVMRYREDPTQRAKAGSPTPGTPSPTANAASAAAPSDGPLGIKSCDDYLDKMKECGDDPQTIAMTRRGFQIKLDEGKSKASIGTSCTTIAKVYKCKTR